MKQQPQPQPQPVGASASIFRRSSTGALPFPSPRPQPHSIGVLRRSSTYYDAPATRNKTRTRTLRPRNNSFDFRFHYRGDVNSNNNSNGNGNLESSTPNLYSKSNLIADPNELVDRIIKFNVSYAPAVSNDGKGYHCMTNPHPPRSASLDSRKQRSLGELMSPYSNDLSEKRRRSSSSVSWCDAAEDEYEYDGINLDMDQSDRFPKSTSASSKISGRSSTSLSREKRRSLSPSAIQMPTDLGLDKDDEYYDTSAGGRNQMRSRNRSAETESPPARRSRQRSVEQQHRRRNRERQRQSRTHGSRDQSRDQHCSRRRSCNMRSRGRSLKRAQGNGRGTANTATDVPTSLNFSQEIRPYVHQDDDLKFDIDEDTKKMMDMLLRGGEDINGEASPQRSMNTEGMVESDRDEMGQPFDEDAQRKMRGGQDTSGDTSPEWSNTEARGATHEIPPPPKSSSASVIHSVATYEVSDGPRVIYPKHNAPFSNKSSPRPLPPPVMSWEKHDQHPVTVTSSPSCQDTFEGTSESKLEKYLAKGSRNIDRHRGSSSNEAISSQGNIRKGIWTCSSGTGRNVSRSRDRSGAGQILFDRAHEKLDCNERQVNSVDLYEAEVGLAPQQIKSRTSPPPPPNSSEAVDMGKTTPSSQKIVFNSNHLQQQQQQHNCHPQMHQIQVPEQQQVYHQHQMLPNSLQQSQSAKEDVDVEWTNYAVKCSARHNADSSKKKERRKSKISGKIPGKLSTHNDRTHLAVKDMPFTDSCGDAGIYTGQVNENGRPDGKGSMKYNNGIFYEGTWVDGSQEEKALTQYNRIRGGFTSWEGKGKVAVKSGQTLPWNAHKNDEHDKNDKTNVRGMEWVDFIGEAGRYTGEVNNYKEPHGRGIMKYNFGLIVEGEWVRGMLKQNPHGRALSAAELIARGQGTDAMPVMSSARSLGGMPVSTGIGGGNGMSVGPVMRPPISCGEKPVAVGPGLGSRMYSGPGISVARAQDSSFSG